MIYYAINYYKNWEIVTKNQNKISFTVINYLNSYVFKQRV